MYEDNNGALMMANAGQPTKRTRHIDIRHFALLDWVERDLVVLERVCTVINVVFFDKIVTQRRKTKIK